MPEESLSTDPARLLILDERPEPDSELIHLISGIKECQHRFSSYSDPSPEISGFLPDLILFAHPSSRNVEIFREVRNKYAYAEVIVSLPEADPGLVAAYRNAGVFDCIPRNGNYILEIEKAVKKALIFIMERKVFLLNSQANQFQTSDDLRPLLAALSTGQSVLHYRILEPIGEGGMGEVYKAEDLKLGRIVAIKILPLNLTRDEKPRLRLVREARSASVLNHPNIVTVHSIEESGELIFIVMEYVKGRSLKAVIEDGPLQNSVLFDIGIQTADALSSAHPAGLIHRDIKPANIIITDEGKVKLLDFGIAKRIGRMEEILEARTETQLTETGAVAGTVGYMSPEQTRGEELDGRTDIFSLGCVLYEAATGRKPFHGPNILAILQQIAVANPPKPTSIRPDLPQELDAIIMRAIAKNKEDRYSGADQLRRELELLRQPRVEKRSVPFQSVNRTARTLLAVTLLFLIAGMVLFALWKQSEMVKPQTIHSIAVLPFLNTNGDSKIEYLSDGITEGIIDNLSKLRQLRVIARSTVYSYKGKSLDPIKVGQELKVDAVVAGSLIQDGENLLIRAELIEVAAGRQMWGQKYTAAVGDLLSVQSRILQEMSGQLRFQLTGEEEKRLAKAHRVNSEAYQLYLQGRYYSNRRTAEGLRKAIDYFSRVIQRDPNFAPAYAGLADCYNLFGVYGVLSPGEAFPAARVAATKALELDETSSEAHVSLAAVERNYYWNWPAAEREFHRAIELNPNDAIAHQWYAEFLVCMDRKKESTDEMNKALRLDPVSIIINTAAGRHLYYKHEFDRAIEQYRTSIEMDPTLSLPHFALGFAYAQKSMLMEAESEFQKAVTLSRNDPAMLGSLGYVYALSGQKPKAKEVLEKLQNLANHRYVTPLSFAVIYIGMGENQRALEWLEKAYQDRSEWLVTLKVEPVFDNLRSDPGFQELVKRLRFP